VDKKQAHHWRRLLLGAAVTTALLGGIMSPAATHAQTPDEGYQEALDRIQAAADSGATELSLFRLGLAEVPPEIGQLTNLERLDLVGNVLTSLPAEIGQLTNLVSLDLRNNALSSLPPAIGQLTALEQLRLTNNALTDLPLEIAQLTNLKALSLDFNSLSSWPAAIAQLTNLQGLSLARNDLSELPPEIGQLANLQELWLTDNSLSSVPPEIAQLANLQTLDLSGNALTSLPPAITQLPNLRRLWVYRNNLSSLSPEIGQLTGLEWLGLRENALTSLPPEIGRLTRLEQLWLSGNALTSLPPEIGQLTELRVLRLRDNALTSLPPELGQLTRLETLLLDGNPLESPPPEIVEKGIPAILEYLREQPVSDLPTRRIPVAGVLLITALSPDGQLLVVFEHPIAHDDWVAEARFLPLRLIDLNTGTETLLEGQTDFAIDAAFSGDGATLVSYHTNGEIIVWDVPGRTISQRIPAIPGQNRLSLSADGRVLVTVIPAVVGQLAVWDLDLEHITEILIDRRDSYAEFREQFDGVTPDSLAAFMLAPDGQTLWVATAYGRIWHWDVASGEVTLWREPETESLHTPIRSLWLVADGTQLVFLERDEDLLYWMDLATGDVLNRIPVVSNHPPAVSVDGTRAAWLDQITHLITVWDAAQPDFTRIIDAGLSSEALEPAQLSVIHAANWPVLHFSPDGQRLIFTGLMATETGDNMILVIDLD
jgi:Leucine-rich repeat (LRR) protein